MEPGRSSQNHIPIILGRPFLATADATINCRTGVMDVSVMNMRVRLNIFKTSSQPSIEDNSDCYLVDVNDELIEETLPLMCSKDYTFIEKENLSALKMLILILPALLHLKTLL
ncbi:hypothetical protein M9H77_21626 [Catharanthus roseus]|uniref:Uncharacterized protein n=1 Tax=Catharanthus roseus TaxID=4058 RepID=A0ACC0AS85_CATRO|nr:hypothetical protein M9H77_21626 [Catharanthus roseus]